jgi:hypothetical protein
MTIGQRFLARLNEAKKEDKKPKFALDRGTEAMKRAMRKVAQDDLADKIAEVMNMAGLPGMYLNKPEVRESVIAAAQDLRSKPNRVRAFLAMHSAMAAFRGMMVEAKGEEDLEGSAFQQLLEEVLIALGAPVEMMTAEAKSVIKSSLRKMAAAMRADQAVKTAIITFARLMQIRVNDKVVGSKAPSAMAKKAAAKQVNDHLEVFEQEDDIDMSKVEPGVRGYLDFARKLALELGIPQNMLDRSETKRGMLGKARADFSSPETKRFMPKLMAALQKK